MQEKRNGKIPIVLMILIVIMICGLLWVKTYNLRKELNEGEYELEKLNTQIEKEHERTADIEAEILYRQTDDYIEDAAKELGLYHPDEIIIKPEE